LLGTGPLVDPDYWGKLCIPLHNLTNLDYTIPRDEGLIWVEFTKTTSDPKKGRAASPQFWDIKRFITKAAQPFDSSKKPIAIRSSIPLIALKARSDSEQAAAKAVLASRSAINAQRSATKSQDALEQTRLYSWVGTVLIVLTVIGLWIAFYATMRTDITSITARVDQIKTEYTGTAAALLTSTEIYKIREAEIQRLGTELTSISAALEALRKENSALKSALSDIQNASPPSPNRTNKLSP